MKIAIVNNCVPFLRGGAEILAESLTEKLRACGHQALLVRIPFRWDPPQKIIEHILACRMMRLPNVDRAIALKFPAYYVPHPNKILWLLHQFRQAYDLWGSPYQGLPNTAEGREIRDMIIRADNSYLPEARRIYTNSEVTATRLKQYNGLDAAVLYPPLFHPEKPRAASYEDFIFAPGRVNAAKRQTLLVESMRYCQTKVRLVVAGSAETGAESEALHAVARKHGLHDRVQIVNRFITEAEKEDWFSRALGCAYIPFDEDSYGYVTLESYFFRKPVITCIDSGGVQALVKDHTTGCVVSPEPRAIAQAMDKLFLDTAAARRMGEAGLDLIRSLRIDWDHVIDRLTA